MSSLQNFSKNTLNPMNEKETFLSSLGSLLPEIDPNCAEKMFEYHAAVELANRSINLTAITDPGESAQKHFYDSVMASKFIKEKAHVIDVGTGGGFPGVPLKIMRPDLRMTLLDATEKKTKTVNSMCAKLGIDADVVCMRAEDAGRGKYRGQFDAAVSRAVANLSALAELCIPFVRKNGVFIAYKSQDAEDIKDTSFCDELGCTLEETFDYPGRRLLIFRKIEKTPDKYPRSFARIKKNPL